MLKKYVPLILLGAYRSAELPVNMLEDNIKIDTKELALIIKRAENKVINT